MRQLKSTLIALLFIIACTNSYGQKTAAPVGGNNIIKVNLSAIAISHYSIQYERVLGKKQSIAIGFGISPNIDLPFKSNLMDQFGDNEDAKRAIATTTFTKFTITPEYRFYVGKKQAPQGFYIAPFLRYTNMSIEQDYTFTPSSGTLHTAHLKGKLNGFGAGFLLGAQWLVGKKKNIAIDWWIAGPFIGTMKADFHGTDPNMDELTQEDTDKLEDDIESTKIPLWTIEASTDRPNKSVDAKLKGPFYGVRAFGICLGYRF